jgi:hypothetical protein
VLESAFAGGGGAGDEEWGLDATRRDESAGERSARTAGERRSRAAAMDGCGFRFGGSSLSLSFPARLGLGAFGRAWWPCELKGILYLRSLMGG